MGDLTKGVCQVGVCLVDREVGKWKWKEVVVGVRKVWLEYLSEVA